MGITIVGAASVIIIFLVSLFAAGIAFIFGVNAKMLLFGYGAGFLYFAITFRRWVLFLLALGLIGAGLAAHFSYINL